MGGEVILGEEILGKRGRRAEGHGISVNDRGGTGKPGKVARMAKGGKEKENERSGKEVMRPGDMDRYLSLQERGKRSVQYSLPG